MIVAREILGNVEEMAEERRIHEERGTLEMIAVSERERNRSRFKTELADGTEIGVILGDADLSPGDVLVASDERMVLVEFEHRVALVVPIPEIGWEEAFELGHHIGNQHWELAIRDDELLVPIVGERRLMERTLREVLPTDAEIGVEEIDPELFDDVENDHGHGSNHDHSHGHDSGGAYSHEHRHGEHG